MCESRRSKSASRAASRISTLFLLTALTVLFFSSAGLQCDFETTCIWDWGKTGDFVLASPQNISNRSFQAEEVRFPSTDADNNKNGHYLYYGVEEREAEIRAQIVSSWFAGGSESRQCTLEMWMHMYNMIDGSVKVLAETENVTWEVSHFSGNNKNAWEKYSHPIGRVSRPFCLIVEVSHARTIVPAHVAVDNIQLINCITKTSTPASCNQNYFRCSNDICIDRSHICDTSYDCLDGEDETMDCEELPWSAYCTFENGTCGWMNSKEDDSEWRVHSGATPRVKTGPSHDHTYKNSSGHYMFANFSTTQSSFGHIAMLKSSIFDPPPLYHTSVNSSLYNSCQVRFFYHMYGAHVGDLRLCAVQMGTRTSEEQIIQMWRIFGNQNDIWHRAVVPLRRITGRFYLQFTASRGMRSTSDTALDDISLSPECFGIGVPENETIIFPFPQQGHSSWSSPSRIHLDEIFSKRYRFSTCDARGPKGPSKTQCEKAYRNSSTEVEILEETTLAGVQRWKVPETGFYTVFARGASGGLGIYNRAQSRAAEVRATYMWTAGERIYILIGHAGTSACSKTSLCQLVRDVTESSDGISNEELLQGGGGGGGGGATLLFKVSSDGQTPSPLVIAGGSGGLSALRSDDPSLAVNPKGRGMIDTFGPGEGASGKDGPGGGGGWNGTSVLPSVGQSLYQGGKGGEVCGSARDWLTHGGFGGGGGACAGGGGGGGYRGGDAPDPDSPETNGKGGTSFISADGALPLIREGASHSMDGYLHIIPAKEGCGCEFLCVILELERKTFHCICPKDQFLNSDGFSCKDGELRIANHHIFPLSVHQLVLIVLCMIISIVVVIFILCFIGHRLKYKSKGKETPPSVTTPEFQLTRLRQTAGGMVTEYNPNYEFGGSTCTIQDLPVVPRNNLMLLRPLGQGAFGEVYEGLLTNMPDEPNDMPVAVKTLPELSSSQSEIDFLMEALIMSKFKHPNIVYFIGVCFEKLPRFIVLELLLGGDLKSFLRESRPKPGQEAFLTMANLLRFAMDVAKGCSYLEENHFIHRDIAARNCLLTKKSLDAVVKIADFGMARDIYRADYYRKGGKAMLPVKWMPPEAFLDGIFTSKTDVWSYGVLLWEIMSLGYMPYPGRGNQEVMQLVTSGGRLEPPTNCPGPVYHMMMQCWHPVPDTRPTFVTILERIGYCAQDPEVIKASLPVFYRPPSREKDLTLMRPDGTDATCLQVHKPPELSLHPSSASDDYLTPILASDSNSDNIESNPTDPAEPLLRFEEIPETIPSKCPEKMETSSASIQHLFEVTSSDVPLPHLGVPLALNSNTHNSGDEDTKHFQIQDSNLNTLTSEIRPSSSRTSNLSLNRIRNSGARKVKNLVPCAPVNASHRIEEGQKIGESSQKEEKRCSNLLKQEDLGSSLHSLETLPYAPVLNSITLSSTYADLVTQSEIMGKYSNSKCSTISLDASLLCDRQLLCPATSSMKLKFETNIERSKLP